MKTGRIVALEVAHFSNGGNTEDLSRGVSRISMPPRGDWEIKDMPWHGCLLGTCIYFPLSYLRVYVVS